MRVRCMEEIELQVDDSERELGKQIASQPRLRETRTVTTYFDPGRSRRRRTRHDVTLD